MALNFIYFCLSSIVEYPKITEYDEPFLKKIDIVYFSKRGLFANTKDCVSSFFLLYS